MRTDVEIVWIAGVGSKSLGVECISSSVPRLEEPPCCLNADPSWSEDEVKEAPDIVIANAERPTIGRYSYRCRRVLDRSPSFWFWFWLSLSLSLLPLDPRVARSCAGEVVPIARRARSMLGASRLEEDEADALIAAGIKVIIVNLVPGRRSPQM